MVKTKVETGFDTNCGACKRRLAESEMTFSRPMGADGKMITTCLKCTKEWDRQNLEDYQKKYIQDIIIPQIEKDKKERDERYEKKMKEMKNDATNK